MYSVVDSEEVLGEEPRFTAQEEEDVRVVTRRTLSETGIAQRTDKRGHRTYLLTRWEGVEYDRHQEGGREWYAPARLRQQRRVDHGAVLLGRAVLGQRGGGGERARALGVAADLCGIGCSGFAFQCHTSGGRGRCARGWG